MSQHTLRTTNYRMCLVFLAIFWCWLNLGIIYSIEIKHVPSCSAYSSCLVLRHWHEWTPLSNKSQHSRKGGRQTAKWTQRFPSIYQYLLTNIRFIVSEQYSSSCRTLLGMTDGKLENIHFAKWLFTQSCTREKKTILLLAYHWVFISKEVRAVHHVKWMLVNLCSL